MKIIFLNTWGGRVSDPLIDFLKRHSDVDVFCLQEVWNGGSLESIEPGERPNLFLEIANVLPEYEGIFAPADEDCDYGLAMYLKKNLLKVADGNIMIHDKAEYFPELNVTAPPRNLQYLTLQVEDYQKLTIVNFHGLWTNLGKDDTKDRLLQSDKIISFLKTLNHSFVLGGDFNLNPDTESLKKFESLGLRNLIAEYGISTTRTPLCTKKEKYADYVFVSKGVHINSFKVLTDEVSDHAPLCVKISV